MENLIITLLTVLVSVLQNPQIPIEQKNQIYQEVLPVITMYMEKEYIGGVGSNGAVGEEGIGIENIKVEEVNSPIIKEFKFNLLLPKKTNMNNKPNEQR